MDTHAIQTITMSPPDHPHWFTLQDDMAVWKMRDSLLTLDDESRVNPYDPEVKRIQTGAEKIIKEMIRSVTRNDPRFGGRFVEMGSYYNQTKIGKPDAFDYGLELRLTDLVSDSGSPENLEWLWKHKGFMSEIKQTFEKLVNAVLEKMAMPSHWLHSGFNQPRYSGFRRHGPACVLQFAYKDPVTDSTTHLLVQLFLIVKVPFSCISDNDKLPVFTETSSALHMNYKLYKYALLDYFQQQRTEYIHLPIWTSEPPCYIEMVIYAMSVLEQKWLNQFSAMAVVKRVIRICRALVSRFIPVAPKHIKSSMKRRIRKSLDGIYAKMDKCRTFQNGVIGFKYLGDPATYEAGSRPPLLSYNDVELDISRVQHFNLQRPGGHHFRDVNEKVPVTQFFSTHVFRHVILTMMSSEKQHGREWTTEDIPRLVVHVFDVINDHLRDGVWLHKGVSCLEFNDKCSSSVLGVLMRNSLFSRGTHRRQMLMLAEVLREMAHDNSHGVSPFKVVRHGLNCSYFRRAYTQTVGLVYIFCLFWMSFVLVVKKPWNMRRRITPKIRSA